MVRRAVNRKGGVCASYHVRARGGGALGRWGQWWYGRANVGMVGGDDAAARCCAWQALRDDSHGLTPSPSSLLGALARQARDI